MFEPLEHKTIAHRHVTEMVPEVVPEIAYRVAWHVEARLMITRSHF